MSIRNPTVVTAFRWAMSRAASNGSSMRTNATRLAPPSATAMHIGWPSSSARFLQAATTRSCASRVSAPAMGRSFPEAPG